ncbi:MAG: cadherin [Bacteroidetes bacterium]|nr:cadherin [Bacteroidota bacterium]
MKLSIFIICFFWSLSLIGQTSPVPLAAPNITLEVFGSGYNSPVDIVHAGDERLFIVEQDGTIRIIDTTGVPVSVPFLDINARVGSSGSEQGLLGLAFPPDYATDGRFYVNYTGNDGDTRISRFSVTADRNVADPSSEQVLLLIDQPFTNHNGGCVRFGPDSLLYIGLGDGGSGGDPGDRSQTPTTLLGKMLRIDVRTTVGYTIPADNPFATNPDTLPEIWHMGLRNPWRYHFDRLTGDLWIADVGQNVWEEINVQPASSQGGENWGWRCYEGNAPFNTSGCSPAGAYNAPVFVYDHASGGFSVTGGTVYRGKAQRNLQGHYVLADYVTGRWWTLQRDVCRPDTLIVHPLGVVQSLISTFGESANGELFCANLASGQIYRVVEACSEAAAGYALDFSLFGGCQYRVSIEGNPSGTYTWYAGDFTCPFEEEAAIVSTDSVAIGNINEFPYAAIWLSFASDEGCPALLGPLLFGIICDGISTPGFPSSWSVYPQPAKEQLFTRMQPGNEGGTMTIYDLQGRATASQRVAGSGYGQIISWNTANWSPGTYTMLWQGADGSRFAQKLIVAQ